MEEESKQGSKTTTWTATQTYVMAGVCLLIGVLVGYLVRGSANPAGRATPASAGNAAGCQRSTIRHGSATHANPG